MVSNNRNKRMKKALVKSTGEIVKVDTRLESSRYGLLWKEVGTSRSFPDSELQLFDDSGVTDFVETWHPDYYHSDMIAWIDDLHCALASECDDEKLSRIKETWGNTPSSWLTELINLESAAYSRALARFYELQYPNVKF